MTTGTVALATLATLSLCAPRELHAQQAPPSQQPGDLGAVASAYLSATASTEWSALDQLPGFKWAPLPPTSLTNCLPNGDCFARQGTAAIDGRSMSVLATGARTIVVNVLLRNQGVPFGEDGVQKSLAASGLTATLARCPVRTGASMTSWYRLTGSDLAAGFISIQPSGPGRPNEGFVLTRGDVLPTLQPNQLALYSERCAAGIERTAVATRKPHESLADAVVALLAPASGPALYDWATLRSRATDITWLYEEARKVDLSVLGDPNPMGLSGTIAWGGRTFSVMATGTATTVKTIHFDEQGLHPRGEHMLGVVYAKGVQVRKLRCGPVYTQSTNDWYALTSPSTHAAAIRQSIRHDGNQVQDAYELRLDGSLPARDARDRDPGMNGCQR